MTSSDIGLAWTMYAVVSVILFLKMLALSMLQVAVRVRSRIFTLPEDAAMFGRARIAAREPALVERIALVWRNDLENIPIFLFLAIAYVVVGCWPTGTLLYFPAFAASRILHTVAYLNRMQPGRTISYVAGMLVCLALAIHLLACVLVALY